MEHFDYDATEAEYLEDTDGIDYLTREESFKQSRLEAARKERLSRMKDKHVIVADGHSHMIYLQDRTISKRGFWTRFKANARVFGTKQEADTECAKFRYNNARVVKV